MTNFSPANHWPHNNQVNKWHAGLKGKNHIEDLESTSTAKHLTIWQQKRLVLSLVRIQATGLTAQPESLPSWLCQLWALCPSMGWLGTQGLVESSCSPGYSVSVIWLFACGH